MVDIEPDAKQLAVRALERECLIQYEAYLAGAIMYRFYTLEVFHANNILKMLGAATEIVTEPSLDQFRPFIHKGSEAE